MDTFSRQIEEKVEVIAYSGYRGEETPRTIILRDKKIEVFKILNRWIEEGFEEGGRTRFFKVKGSDGNTHNIYYDEEAKEWFGDRHMSIVLVAVGEVDRNVIEALKNDLNKVFNRQVLIGEATPEPHYAFNKKRNQYLSTAILKAIMEQKDDTAYGKILGIVDHDLYVPELNFVFGEAGRKAAVISLTRLRQEFYHMPENRSLFHQKILTEAVHE